MMKHQRPWDALPSSALLNIFYRTSIKDRSRNIPLVCKSWAHASGHPHCWVSMIADNYYSESESFEVAFLKDYYPYAASFVDPFDGRRSDDPRRGIVCLQALIGRAGGGFAVNSLYFFPFLTSFDGPPNDDALLRLIANHCPNLKHLSFHGSYHASEEAIFDIFRSCRELELIDFSNSPYFNPSILQELSCCCPKIRGIRRKGDLEPNFAYDLTKWFPRLRLLNLSYSTIVDIDLFTIVTNCKELQYLDVTGCQQLIRYMHISLVRQFGGKGTLAHRERHFTNRNQSSEQMGKSTIGERLTLYHTG
ncbi:putative F-box/LRR-repeat protein 19 [Forsythia ovata]|uniref:F-box/LRR-repeat protein 19 n=1 Tax=Forsythia ovata TaxID=205694 RepID=A0ABD1VKG1_9LAMI